MKLFGKAPWKQQPQIPVGINWSNPITRGLVFATADGKVNAATGKKINWSNSDPTKSGGQAGLFIEGNGSRYADLGITLANSPLTLFSTWLSRTTSQYAAVDADRVVFSTRTAGNAGFSWGRNAATGGGAGGNVTRNTHTVQGVAQYFASALDIPSLVSTAVAVTVSGTTLKHFTAGALITTTTIGAGTNGGNLIFLAQGPSGGVPWLDRVANGFAFNRALSDAEIKSLSDNPWQIFQPLARSVYFGVPAAGYTYTLTADSGSFALTGQTVSLAFNRVLAADTQSYALTGQAVGLAFNRTLSAASGSFSLDGQDAGLAFNRVLSAASGSYALAGQDATLTYTPIGGPTYTLVAASGAFALAGQDTGLAFNRVLAADTQGYSLAGQAAGLAFNRVLVADTTSFALTGQDATLTYTTNGYTYTIAAESGSFALAGQDAVLSWSGDQTSYAGEIDLTPSKWYVKRNKKILLFNNAQEADAFLEAEQAAEQAIQQAQKTSRRARKRLRDKIITVEPIQTVDVDQLAQAVERFSIPVDLPKLLAQMDYDKVMKTIAIAADLADEEDIEMLLLM